MTATLPQAELRPVVWESLTYEPHEAQQLIHASTARHRVLDAGRRLGKSTIGGHELIPIALETAMRRDEFPLGRYFWIVGPNYDDCIKEWRVFWAAGEALKLPWDHPGTYDDRVNGNMRASLWGGRFILECKSAQYPNSLDGEGLEGVILAEAAKLKPLIWGKYIRPALADKRGWSLWNSTPEGKNHFYEAWQRGQDPSYPDWESWRMPSWYNTRVFPGGEQDPEILDMRREMSDERYAQEIEAKFTDFVGLVFKGFDEEIHVRDLQYRPDLPLYGACDYGWTNPFVWLVIQVDVWGTVYVLREYRDTHVDIKEHADLLAEWSLAANAVKFFPDPAGPDETSVISNRIKVQANTDTGGPLKTRLEYIRQALKVGPEHAPIEDQLPKLFVDRSCTGLIDEFGKYRYPDTKSEQRPNPEEPLDRDNHAPEALGRFFRGYFGKPATDEPDRVVVRKANMRTRR